ncbi:Alpha-tocopherol transfer protein, partial [Caligus rogercresseyi]
MFSDGEVETDGFDAGFPFSDNVFAKDGIWQKRELELFGANLSEDLIQEFCEGTTKSGIHFDGTKDSIEVLRKYLENKRRCAQYYIKDNMTHIRSVLNLQNHIATLHRDSLGRRVFIIRPGRWDTNKATISDMYCVSAMLCEFMATEFKSQISGSLVIFDGEGFGYSQLRTIGIQDAKNTADFM